MTKQQLKMHSLFRTFYRQAWFTLVFTFGILSLLGCVSINIGGEKIKRADGVSYTEPSAPFEEEDMPHVDKAWKNPSNGNSISFLSDCRPGNDPDLESLRSGVLTGLSKVEIKNEDRSKYNNRAALRSEASGFVDGIQSKFDLMIFKKNGCIYILTYVALAESYDQDRSAFDKFLDGFKAP